MPRGFIGRAAAAYLGQVSQAHTNAVSASRQTPAHAPDGPWERQLPFALDEAFTGGLTPRRGDSSNIVVSQQDYEDVCYAINKADDKIGECLYRVATEIEAMCQTSFILPAAVPRCLNISDSVKNSLGQFRALTDDATIQARRFAHEIISIG